MSHRDARLARNEDHFRSINESLREKHVHAPVVRSGPLPFVCECASPDCTEAVELTLDEYRRVRKVATRFVVVPGHQAAEVEVTVEEEPGFVIVEKLGQAETAAHELEHT